MSIYTYDADLTIDWNDPYRNNKKRLLNMTAGANPSAVNANAGKAHSVIHTHTHTYIHTNYHVTIAATVGRKRLASVVSQNLLSKLLRYYSRRMHLCICTVSIFVFVPMNIHVYV
jgi:hypothetical protein